ncbi:uncharacterized protein [Amphiura filiformis]|uniref:uncharacterized protein n=1 Tax=Amphiura filiformis TaxID=82378 RepID=UPI003B22477F
MSVEIQSTGVSSSRRAKHDAIPFREFVQRNEKNLPSVVHVTNSSEKDIVKGDVLQLLYACERYEAEFQDPQLHRKIRCVLPPDLGGFRTVSQYPLNHVYTSFHEIALDFPPSIRILEDVKIQDTVVHKGEGLKLNKIQMIGTKQYIFCQHMPFDKPLMVPLDLKGKFRRRNDEALYTVEQLKSRMPVLVKLELGEGDALRSHTHEDLGIPENVEMFLTMSKVVQVEHWHRPTRLQSYISCEKRDMILKLDRDLQVAPLGEVIGPAQDLADVLKNPNTTYPVFAIVHDNEYYPELPKDKILIIHGNETKEGVVMRGNSSYLLVPKDYDQVTQFWMRGKEYPTPLDLWKSGHAGEVTVWYTVKSPKGFQESVRSLYRMDRVNLVRMPDENQPFKVLSNNYSDEIEIVELHRTFSNVNALLGNISVEGGARVGLEEAPSIVGDHSLANILRYGELPMDIALCHVSQIEDCSMSDMILICESPFKVLKECMYTVTHVTTYETNPEESLTFEIPEFAQLQIKLAKGTSDVPKNFQKPKSRVHKLSMEAYYQLTGEALDYGNYEDIDDTLFLLSHSDPNRYMPIQSPPVTPPLSPRPGTRMPSRPPASLPVVSSSATPPVLPRPRRHTHEECLPSTSVRLPVMSTTLLMPPRPRPRPSLRADSLPRRPVPEVPTPPKPPTRLASKLSSVPKPYTERTPPVPRPRRPPSDPATRQAPTSPRHKDGYLEAFVINDTTIPKVRPPADNIITSFDVTHLAGMMRYLDFGDHAIVNCVHQKIDGAKLLEIFRSKSNDEEIVRCLKVEKLSEVHCLKHFVTQSELAEAIPDVKPPSDGDISEFGVQELAGLLKHLKVTEQTLSACLVKQINGMILCNMDADTMSKELGLGKSGATFLALQYFKSQSQPQ